MNSRCSKCVHACWIRPASMLRCVPHLCKPEGLVAEGLVAEGLVAEGLVAEGLVVEYRWYKPRGTLLERLLSHF